MSTPKTWEELLALANRGLNTLREWQTTFGDVASADKELIRSLVASAVVSALGAQVDLNKLSQASEGVIVAAYNIGVARGRQEAENARSG